MVINESTKVSVIIRTKNEETLISQCLGAVFAQSHNNIEVIIVDNMSTDATIMRVQKHDVKVVMIEEFRPGRALNKGIEHSSGDIVVCLSGHCVPSSKDWLKNLVSPLEDAAIAGVYGRQIPTEQTSAIDARDLYLVFGLDSKRQYQDSFFHNANSAFLRKTWEEVRFCDEVTNIEDRLWGEEIIKRRKQIYYSSEASVFHWHGIHHNQDESRADKIHAIAKSLAFFESSSMWAEKQYTKRYCAFLPVLAESVLEGPINLLEITLKQILTIKEVESLYVSCDTEELISYCTDFDPRIKAIKRGPDLCKPGTPLDCVLKDFVVYLDRCCLFYDYICLFQISYPLRDMGHVRDMFRMSRKKGYETVRAVLRDMRFIECLGFAQSTSDDAHFMPKLMKSDETHIELTGYCLITVPARIRTGTIYQKPLGTSVVKNAVTSVAIRSERELDYVKTLLT